MAEELDIEAMLEEAVDTRQMKTYDNGSARSGSGSSNNDGSDSASEGGDSGSDYEQKTKHRRVDNNHESDDRKRSDKGDDGVERSRSREISQNRTDTKATRDTSRSKSRETSKSRSDRRRKSRSRSRDKDRKHRRSRSRDRRRRSRSRERRRRSRSRDRHRRSRSRDRYRRSRSRDRRRHDSPRRSDYISPEERDQRTVFCMQIAQRVQARDIEDFFSQVGKVKEVRLIMDHRSRRHKGIAYVEFKSIDSVGKAIALTGTRLMGVPVVVQHSQAEKNRMAAQAPRHPPKAAHQAHAAVAAVAAATAATTNTAPSPNIATSGPMALYVGSLHFNVNEEMLKGIFEPFGTITNIEISRDINTRRSNGFGFVHFAEAQDAKKAMEQLNGFELAGRPMKVNHITEGSGTVHHYVHHSHHVALDSDEVERGGVDLGTRGRLELMARLAEGTDIEIPKQVRAALSNKNGSVQQQQQLPVSTQCFFLSNMFDPTTETEEGWVAEIRNDVIEECRKHGGVLHVYVDETAKEGHVYVKCASVASAVATINALHGRWFAGRMITASFVPIQHYHNLFPDAATAKNPL